MLPLKKAVSGLSSPWGERIDARSPLPEYPRPELSRPDWLSLNGYWEYAARPSAACALSAEPLPATWDGRIVVPFAVETALSGVGSSLSPVETLWYRRVVSVPASWAGRRVALRFEAVDYEAAVFVDGRLVGEHRGGYLPFSVELPAGSGASERDIVVAVRDPSDGGFQQRGKQVLHPAGILYTATSGIWQAVWMEPLPVANAITGVRADTRPDMSGASVIIACEKPASVRLVVKLPSGAAAEYSGRSGEPIDVAVPEPRLWSPADPYLYDVRAEIREAGADLASAAIDTAVSYFALRIVDIGPIAGAARGSLPAIRLNGKPLFVNAPLDQGYWPESGLTAPSDEALVFDIEAMKALGFNGLRKHIKVEPRRFYYHADRLGMLVIQDAVSGGVNRASGNLKTGAAMVLDMHAKDDSEAACALAGRADKANRDEFESDLAGMVGLLRFHPSIIMWTVFNESWGQFESERVVRGLRAFDGTRLIDAVSGWYDQGGGDFRSRHTYIVKLKKPPRRDRRPYFISEFGGYNLAVPGHMWDDGCRFGYRFFSDEASLQAGYASLMRDQLIPLVARGLRAAVYTQVSDVEIESNGFYTYDRKVLKFDASLVRALNDELYAAFAGLSGGAGEGATR